MTESRVSGPTPAQAVRKANFAVSSSAFNTHAAVLRFLSRPTHAGGRVYEVFESAMKKQGVSCLSRMAVSREGVYRTKLLKAFRSIRGVPGGFEPSVACRQDRKR